MASDPIRLFRSWQSAAARSGAPLPEAMVLSTSDPGGGVSARVMLLKGVDGDGFVFFTNYESRKGKALQADPRAALTFFWPSIGRQVRITGVAARIAAGESDEYFRSRPRRSRLGAWASEQSSVISSRISLVKRYAAAAARYRGKDVPRPPHWGGFRLAPHTIEFWRDRPFRLHDRMLYTKTDKGWTVQRLSP